MNTEIDTPLRRVLAPPRKSHALHMIAEARNSLNLASYLAQGIAAG
ncbi:MAG TPA: hypothetical protein VIY68_15950 [Steroidobacteraceae bacterium]